MHPDSSQSPASAFAIARFGLRNDRFGIRNDRFGVRNDRFGPRNGRFGPRNDHFGLRNDRFGIRNAPVSLRNGHFAMWGQNSTFGSRGFISTDFFFLATYQNSHLPTGLDSERAGRRLVLADIELGAG